MLKRISKITVSDKAEYFDIENKIKADDLEKYLSNSPAIPAPINAAIAPNMCKFRFAKNLAPYRPLTV